MSYNTNAKVNPFYIQDDEEDPWDDDYGDGEYGKEDYDDEQVMLISGSGNNNNRKYNDALPNNLHRRHSVFGHNNFFRSYHDGQYEMHGSDSRHRPQLFKYGVLLFTIAVVVFGLSSSSNEFENEGSGSEKNIASLLDKTPNDDYRIVVLGERHSGTVWMRDRLRECFPNAEISTDLQRMGYLFQDDEATALSKEEALGKNHHTIAKNNVGTIVVHVTLNIYDWLEQMRLSPEYAPDHVGKHHELGHNIPLGWEEFLYKPWTTERPPTDLLLANETGPVCQMGFHYNEIVSCAEPTGGIGDPLYELQPDGHPYESIIDLRTAKLKNHHGIQDSWPSVEKMIQLPYETIAQDFKHKLLQEILVFTKWNGGSYEHDGVSLPCSGNVLPPSLDSSNEMTLEFVDYVTEHADWETEEDVASYVRWTESDIFAKGIRPATTASTSPKAANIDEGSVDEDYKNKQAASDDSTKTQETKDAILGLESSPPPSNKLSMEDITEAKPEIEANEIEENVHGIENSSSSGSSQDTNDFSKKESDDATNDNLPSKQITEEDNSAKGSSNDQKAEEENEDIDSPLPYTRGEPHDENSTEPPQTTREEPPAVGNENSKEDEILEEKDTLFKDPAPSTNNSFDEKQVEHPSSTESSPDEKEQNGASATTLIGNDGPSEEAGESFVATTNETAQEDKPKTERGEVSDNNIESNQKDVVAEKYAGNSDNKESLQPESVSDTKEVVTQAEKQKESEGNEIIADEDNKIGTESEKQEDSEGKGTTVDCENKNGTEAVVSASKPEETVQEGQSNAEIEIAPDNNTESSKEVLTVEKNAGNSDHEEASPSKSASEGDETETKNDNVKATETEIEIRKESEDNAGSTGD